MIKNFWQNLHKPFFALAPMYDVTDPVLREIITLAAKPDVLFTEFVCADAFFTKAHERILNTLKYKEAQRPIVAQVWGANPQKITVAARLIKELGFDGIDINMGCPEKSVIKSGAGAALINNPTLAAEIINAAKTGADNLPISIKTRIGYKASKTEEWVAHLLKQKVDAITIHGRTATNLYKGEANWSEIAKTAGLKDEISPQTKIIGNGDVTDLEDAYKKHKEHKVDGVMVGRGIFSNLWFFEKDKSREHSQEETLKMLITHAKLYEDQIKDRGYGNFESIRKFFRMYARDFDGAENLRSQLLQCSNAAEIEKKILTFLLHES